MKRSRQPKSLWQSPVEIPESYRQPLTMDCGRSMCHMARKPLLIRWATPALQSLSQATGMTGRRGQRIVQELTSDGAR